MSRHAECEWCEYSYLDSSSTCMLNRKGRRKLCPVEREARRAGRKWGSDESVRALNAEMILRAHANASRERGKRAYERTVRADKEAQLRGFGDPVLEGTEV